MRNTSVVGAHVCSHSGEFSFHVVDLALRGRRIPFEFARVYRSARHQAAG